MQSYEGEAAMILEMQGRTFFKNNNYNLNTSHYWAEDHKIAHYFMHLL